jgi:uncharacterized membrane protein
MMMSILALMSTRSRAYLSLALAAVTFLLSSSLLHPWTALVLTWIVVVLFWVFLVILMMNHIPAEETAERARYREPRSGFMLFVTVVVTIASLGAMAYMVANLQAKPAIDRTFHIVGSVIAVFSSWLLLHTRFGLYYASMYYNEAGAIPPQPYAKGLEFQGEQGPSEGPFTFWDFMYVSFTIATTAAVSDVNVTSHTMRKIILFHSLVSFLFYTVILGLVINGVSNLL